MTEIDQAVERGVIALRENGFPFVDSARPRAIARAVLAASGWAERLEYAESRAGLALVDMTRAEQRVAALEAALREVRTEVLSDRTLREWRPTDENRAMQFDDWICEIVTVIDASAPAPALSLRYQATESGCEQSMALDP